MNEEENEHYCGECRHFECFMSPSGDAENGFCWLKDYSVLNYDEACDDFSESSDI